MTLETALLGKDVEYRTYLCDGGAPWLGSMSFLYESDATINFRSGIAHFRNLDPENHVLLKRMSSGHLGLAIHDPGDRHPNVAVKHTIVQQLSKLSQAMSESGLSN